MPVPIKKAKVESSGAPGRETAGPPETPQNNVVEFASRVERGESMQASAVERTLQLAAARQLEMQMVNLLEEGKRRAAALARVITADLRRAAREKPLHLIAAVAAASFAAGILLRLWRSHE